MCCPSAGRETREPCRTLAHVDGKSQALHAAEARMLELDDVAVGTRQRIAGRVVEALDDVRRHALRGEQRAPVRGALARERRLERVDQLEAVQIAALVVRVEARIRGIQPGDRGEIRPPAVGVGHRRASPSARRRWRRASPTSGWRRRDARSGSAAARPSRSRERPAGRGSRRTCCPRTARCRPAGPRRSPGGAAAPSRCRRRAARGVHRARAGVDRRLARLLHDRHHAGARRGEFVDRRQITVPALRAEARDARHDDIRRAAPMQHRNRARARRVPRAASR